MMEWIREYSEILGLEWGAPSKLMLTMLSYIHQSILTCEEKTNAKELFREVRDIRLATSETLPVYSTGENDMLVTFEQLLNNLDNKPILREPFVLEQALHEIYVDPLLLATASRCMDIIFSWFKNVYKIPYMGNNLLLLETTLRNIDGIFLWIINITTKVLEAYKRYAFYTYQLVDDVCNEMPRSSSSGGGIRLIVKTSFFSNKQLYIKRESDGWTNRVDTYSELAIAALAIERTPSYAQSAVLREISRLGVKGKGEFSCILPGHGEGSLQIDRPILAPVHSLRKNSWALLNVIYPRRVPCLDDYESSRSTESAEGKEGSPPLVLLWGGPYHGASKSPSHITNFMNIEPRIWLDLCPVEHVNVSSSGDSLIRAKRKLKTAGTYLSGFGVGAAGRLANISLAKAPRSNAEQLAKFESSTVKLDYLSQILTAAFEDNAKYGYKKYEVKEKLFRWTRGVIAEHGLNILSSDGRSPWYAHGRVGTPDEISTIAGNQGWASDDIRTEVYSGKVKVVGDEVLYLDRASIPCRVIRQQSSRKTVVSQVSENWMVIEEIERDRQSSRLHLTFLGYLRNEKNIDKSSSRSMVSYIWKILPWNFALSTRVTAAISAIHEVDEWLSAGVYE